MPRIWYNRIWELRALRDLAMIHNAAVSYYHKHQTFPADLKVLVDQNYLPDAYAFGSRFKYRFYPFRPVNAAEFGIHAEPLDPQAGLRFFYVGTDAVIREAYGERAKPDSTPHEY